MEFDAHARAHLDFCSGPRDRQKDQRHTLETGRHIPIHCVAPTYHVTNCEACPDFKLEWLCQACKEKKGWVKPDGDEDDEDNYVDADDDLSDATTPSQPQLNVVRQQNGTWLKIVTQAPTTSSIACH
jgi:hypothetical protein